MRALIAIALVSMIASGCGGGTVCAPAPPSMDLEPSPLTRIDSGHWSLGPYTQGTLHISLVNTDPEAQTLILRNRGRDSLRISFPDYQKFLPTGETIPLAITWNLDAAMLRVNHADTLCFQLVLPIMDDLGVHNLEVGPGIRIDSLSSGSLIQDPPDLKIAYWGNSTGPDGSLVQMPWNTLLAEQVHSQGVFLRMMGFSPDIVVQKPIEISREMHLEEILSRQPAYLILSGGWALEHAKGGAGIPAFREAMFSILEKVKLAGVQPIVLISPPLPEERGQKARDIRAEYNMELRTLAANTGAPVVDLSDRFRDPQFDEILLQNNNEELTQAGHQVVAESIFSLIRYYLEFGGK